MKTYGYLLGGEEIAGGEKLEVRSPYSGETVAEVHLADEAAYEKAIEKAQRASPALARLSSCERYEILTRAAHAVRERAGELVRMIALEGGKVVKLAEGEVARCANTLTVAAEETKRIGGEVLRLDWVKNADRRWGLTKRFPVGPVLGITPFNFPLNLVAHKVAPAIAAGCAIVIKPASATPVSALSLGEILYSCGLPAGALSVLPARAAVAEKFAGDERFRMLSFTGSAAVGWKLKTLAGKKRVTLELGGNAAVIVHHDADIAKAPPRCVFGAFAHAGQVCIHLQRIYVHESVFEEFVKNFLEHTAKLTVGDPLERETDIGPMIEAEAAWRANGWVNEAISAGAQALAGNRLDGNFVCPTVLTNTSRDMKVVSEEVFAPVVVIERYGDFDEALSRVNDSRYGLQAGVFTKNLSLANRAFETLEVGGVIVGDIPTWRVDHMPYGGEKDSGFGREGLKWAIEEMTRLRLLVIKPD
jgi:glyceraldehyde-3-phosphate dehydrogenase (NADP+)